MERLQETSRMNSGLKQNYIVKTTKETRSDYDYYPTPAIATFVLTKMVNLPDKILEPCAGRGHISKILEMSNISVESYDLVRYDNCYVPIQGGNDYLELPRQNVGGIVTNPPYHKKLPEKFLRKALEVDKYPFVAFLARNTFCESVSRYSLFEQFPPSLIIQFSDRINFGSQDLYYIDAGFGGLTSYCWYIWDYRKTWSGTHFNWVLARNYKDELKEFLNVD